MMKQEKGITLVALVITIIVLLILAGVSISLVLGNNGVLTQASGAVMKNREATARQEIAMAFASLETQYFTEWAKDTSKTRGQVFTKNNMQTYLAETGIVDEFSYNATTGIITGVYQSFDNNLKYPFTIDTQGNVTMGTSSQGVATGGGTSGGGTSGGGSTTPESNPSYDPTAETSTFSIGSTEYQFIEGMTFGQWVASAYNVDGYRVLGNSEHGIVETSSSTDTRKSLIWYSKTTNNNGSYSMITEKVQSGWEISATTTYNLTSVTMPAYWYLRADGEMITGTDVASEQALVTAFNNGAQVVHCPDGTYTSLNDYNLGHAEPRFILNGKSYHYDTNMTLAQWVSSTNNTDGYRLLGNSTNGLIETSGSTDREKTFVLVSNGSGGYEKASAGTTISSSTTFYISTINSLDEYWILLADGNIVGPSVDATTEVKEATIAYYIREQSAQVVHCPHGTYSSASAYNSAHN